MRLFTNLFKGKGKASQASSWLRSKNISHLIYATPIHSERKESSHIIAQVESLILDVVDVNESLQARLDHWQYIYYKHFPHHYSLSGGDLSKVAGIEGFENMTSRNVYELWPKEMSSELYKQVYNLLQINLVTPKSTPANFKSKYIITPNENFWDIETRPNHNLLTDITSTYERVFSEEELVHIDKETAVLYAIIIFDRLCNQRGPDNSYYYHEQTFKQIKHLPADVIDRIDQFNINYKRSLPIFNYDDRYYKLDDKKMEYQRIINAQRNELEFLTCIFSNITNPPFYITRNE